MTTYQLSASFNTREEAEEYINLNLGEDSLYEVEKVNDEVFEGETEALNKLYRNVGLPVKDSEPTDD